MPNPGLFEMKAEREVELQACEAIIARAEKEKRETTPAENLLVDERMSSVKKLNGLIGPIEAKNTLLGKFGSLGAIMDAGRPDPNTQPQGQNRGSSTLQEALRSCTAEQMDEVKSFASYLGGNMSALANLSPSGDGALIIPTTIADVVERNYFAFTPVVNVARVWPTATGAPERFPVISDSEEAEQLAPTELTGLDPTVTGDTPPTALTGPMLGAYKISSKPVFIPRETLTDSTLSVMEEILMALMARIYRKENKLYTKGSGTGEAQGFLQACSVFTSATALDLDSALDLAYNVPALYRPNGCYMASDTTVKYLRKLKTGLSGDKRALWKDAFEEGNATLGTPAKLHGYNLYVNNDMDSVSPDGTFAGVSPLAFGDFKRFVVRQAEQGSPFVYRWTIPAKDGGAVIAFRRSDSKLLVPEAISRLVHSGS